MGPGRLTRIGLQASRLRATDGNIGEPIGLKAGAEPGLHSLLLGTSKLRD